MSLVVEDRIEMKALLRESGISSGDLHNWVKRGLLPRAIGRYAGPGPGSVYYYPARAVDRARAIKRMRDLGYSGQKIRKIMRGEEVES
ncbi:hypothetical protein ES703_74164 [subsurface metagenome]